MILDGSLDGRVFLKPPGQRPLDVGRVLGHVLDEGVFCHLGRHRPLLVVLDEALGYELHEVAGPPAIKKLAFKVFF